MRKGGLTELEAMLAVARRGSFRAASQELGLSTSAVSAAVANLEARLAVRLFHRTTRSVALTEAGQRYVQRVAPALAEIRAAGEEVQSEPETPAGTLRISAPPGGMAIAMPVFEEFLNQYPLMRLDIVTEAKLVDIVANGFDAGIRLAEALPKDMIAVPVSADLRIVIVASPHYLAHAGTPEQLKDLDAHQTIRLRMSHGGLYKWELSRKTRSVEVDPPSRLVLSEMAATIAAAKAGLGLAFISEWHIQAELEAGTLVRVLEDWCPSFPGLRLYYPGHRHVPASLRALLDIAKRHYPAR